MSIYFVGTNILFDSGHIAFDEDCCCECTCNMCDDGDMPTNLELYWLYETPVGPIELIQVETYACRWADQPHDDLGYIVELVCVDNVWILRFTYNVFNPADIRLIYELTNPPTDCLNWTDLILTKVYDDGSMTSPDTVSISAVL